MSQSAVKPLNEQQKQIISQMIDRHEALAWEDIDAEDWRIVEIQAEITELEKNIVEQLKRGINNGSLAIVATGAKLETQDLIRELDNRIRAELPKENHRHLCYQLDGVSAAFTYNEPE